MKPPPSKPNRAKQIEEAAKILVRTPDMGFESCFRKGAQWADANPPTDFFKQVAPPGNVFDAFANPPRTEVREALNAGVEKTKTAKDGYLKAIELIRLEIRKHYGCDSNESCDHEFDKYGDALAESVIKIRTLISRQDEAMIVRWLND